MLDTVQLTLTQLRQPESTHTHVGMLHAACTLGSCDSTKLQNYI